MCSGVEGNGIRDSVSASNLVGQVQFNGLVNPHPSLPLPLPGPTLLPRLPWRHPDLARMPAIILQVIWKWREESEGHCRIRCIRKTWQPLKFGQCCSCSR